MNGFETFVPGLLLAVAPALVAIAVQGVQSRRAKKAADRAALRAAGLELIDRANSIAFLLPFTQSHADGATRKIALPSLVLGFLQPFDLERMADQYSERFNTLFSAAAVLRATGDENLELHADSVVEATTQLFEAYMSADGGRSRWQQWHTPRALDSQRVQAAADRHFQAVRALESAVRER